MLKPNKLLEKLPAKELVGIILQHEVQDICDKEIIFTKEEIKVAIDKIDKNQISEYKSYIELLELVKGIQYEARIAALHALWRLSLSIMKITKLTEEDAKLLLSFRNSICSQLKIFYVLQSALQIIDDVMGCKVVEFVKYEKERLDETLELYNHFAGFIEDTLAEAAYKKGEEIDDETVAI